MTDIEQKALALLNEIEHERGEDELTPRIMRDLIIDEALCRAIEQHEAFRQEVSDAVANWKDMSDYSSFETMLKLAEQDLFGFIIPTPKPDPLVAVLDKMLRRRFLDPLPDVLTDEAHWLRAELEARGLEIREKGQ